MVLITTPIKELCILNAVDEVGGLPFVLNLISVTLQFVGLIILKNCSLLTFFMSHSYFLKVSNSTPFNY